MPRAIDCHRHADLRHPETARTGQSWVVLQGSRSFRPYHFVVILDAAAPWCDLRVVEEMTIPSLVPARRRRVESVN